MLKRSTQVTVYLTKEEREKFKKFAQKQGRSLTAQIRISMLKDMAKNGD